MCAIVNDERIIAALLTTTSISDAAKECKISKTTIYQRLKDPEFNTKYRTACRELLRDHTAALQGHMGAAISTMREILDNPKNSPQVRLNAADGILRHGLNLTEQMDIVSQLEELERRFAESED